MKNIYYELINQEFEEIENIKEEFEVNNDFLLEVCVEIEYQLEKFGCAVNLEVILEILKNTLDLYRSEYNIVKPHEEPRSLEDLVEVVIPKILPDLFEPLSNEEIFDQDDSISTGTR